MKGVSELQNTLFQFSQQKNPINSRVKRSDDNKSLVEATAKNNYKYCLNQEDLIEIVRLEYKNYRSDKFYTMFKIINSLEDLQKIIKIFLKKRKTVKINVRKYVLL